MSDSEEFAHAAGIWKILGRRWTLAILEDLNAAEARRFTELKRFLGISGTMLTERLLELEKEGLVEKKIYSSTAPKTEYRLTAGAKELLLIMGSLGVWRARQNSANKGHRLAAPALSP